MNISTCFSFLMLCLTAANAWQEFGRPRTYAYEKPILKRLAPVNNVRAEQESGLGILRQLEEVLDSDVEVMSFSMSMSMSFSYNGGSSPSSSATRPPTASSPTAVPTLPPSSSSMPSDMPSLVPSSGPTTTSTFEPTNVPTITPAPSVSSGPSSSAEPTGVPSTSPVTPNTPSPTVFDDQIFQCDGNRITLGEPSELTVSVFLTVGYLVESTSNNTDDFVGELENSLFGIALLAALGCQDNHTLNRRLLENRRKLHADTTIVGTCDPEVPQAVSCHYMETDLVFWVNGDDEMIDTDNAAYAGYVAIQENMENGSLLVIVPTIVRLEYLSPFPLFVPPAANGGDDNSGTTPPLLVASRDNGSNNVSPWTIGACVATIMGGLVSMVVWSRNRQNRRDHVQLLEEVEQEDPIYRGASRNAVTI